MRATRAGLRLRGPRIRFIAVYSAAIALALIVSCVSTSPNRGSDARRNTSIKDVSDANKNSTAGGGSAPPVAANASAGFVVSGADVRQEPPAHAVPQDPETSSRPASAPAAESQAAQESNPFVRFGPHVLAHPDGKLTKFFAVRATRGKFMQDMLIKYAGISAPQSEVLTSADIQDLRVNPYAAPAVPAALPISDWIAVTGTVEEIERADRFVNLYFSSIPQIEIEARIAEVTTSDVTDIGVRATDPTKPSFQAGKHNFIQSLNPKFPNVSTGAEGLLSLTAVQSPIQFQATLELLASRRDVDIISTPRIAVRNGGRAEIVNGNEIPYAEITTVVGGVPTSTVRYKQTGIKLYVTPYLAGTDTVLLNLEVESSIPTNVTETSIASINPIVATRSAKTDVQIRDGNTFVIGGLISTNNLEQVNKIPILGDIPILGLLFRSTLTQKTYTEVLFFITPRVIRDQASQAIIVPNPY